MMKLTCEASARLLLGAWENKGAQILKKGFPAMEVGIETGKINKKEGK